MTKEFLPDPEPARNSAPLAGSLDDLVARAQGRPIYCTPSLAVRRALMDVVVASLRRDFPAAAFVDALALYRNYSDWDRRWPSQHERYGAGIIVTRAENLPEGTDPFAGLAWRARDRPPRRHRGRDACAGRASCRVARGRVPGFLLAIPFRDRVIQSYLRDTLCRRSGSTQRRSVASDHLFTVRPAVAGVNDGPHQIPALARKPSAR